MTLRRGAHRQIWSILYSWPAVQDATELPAGVPSSRREPLQGKLLPSDARGGVKFRVYLPPPV